ncbi:MAG: hypothetical protein H6907_16695 [Hyphomicrobiales bacterium]|nr:hypothetical protein [Hyphomicrobiales bacterium]MCP5373367.1 hypothetical protein [Hyphomicrobiales bacterium]
MIARLGKLFIILSVVLLVGATAWWFLFYEPMLGENVKKASECFYYTTDLCTVGNMAGGFMGDVPTYSPLAFWGAVGALVLGLALIVLAPKSS